MTQHVSEKVAENSDDEKLREKIKQLKEKEKKLREERHRLEAQLRERIFRRFKEQEEKMNKVTDLP
jgi:hypothetical protein